MFFIVSTSHAATYYTFTNGTPSDVNNWWSNNNGTGSHPSNFNNTVDIFIIQSGDTMTTNNPWNLSGSLQIDSGGTFIVAGNTVTISGTTTISGILQHNNNANTKTYGGLVTINPGGSWNNSGNSPITFRGGITNNGTFASGNGIQTFNASQIINGNLTISTIVVTGASVNLSNNGTFTISSALSGSGTLTNNSGTTLNIGGTVSITNFNNLGTASIGGSGAISTALANFINSGTLNLGGTGSITGVTNNGTVNLASSGTIGTFINANVLQISAATTNISNLTTTANGNIVNYNGSGNQNIKANGYRNLILSNGGIKSFPASNLAIAETLTISPGVVANLATGSHTAARLNLGGFNASSGSWGSTTSSATNQNDTYFSATTGIVTMSATSCTMPNQPTLTGGGTTCNSATGVPIGLSSSQNAVSYQLYRGSTALNTVTGTGGAISFGNINVSGTYYVVATSTAFCSVRSLNTVNVTSYTTPAIPSGTITGVNNCPSNTNGAITITGTPAPAALSFLSSNNQVVNLGTTLLSGRNKFTVEGWIKFDKNNYGNRMALFGQNDAIEIAFEDSNLRCWTPGGGSVDLPLSAYPSDNNWHHIAVTGDGTAGGLRIYLDGGTPRTGGSNTSNYGTSGSTTKIGFGVMDAAGLGFTGQIFKVGFWDKALTAAEVGALAGGFVDYNASQEGLLAGFNFSEGTGQSIASVGSNAVSGALGTNATMPTWTDPSTYSWTSTGGFTSSSKNLTGLTSRTYNLDISLKNCSRSTSFTINSTNAATVISSQSTDAQTRCIGSAFNSISVTATGTSLTYQWYRNTAASTTGGTSLTGNGATTNTYTPQSNTASTYYYYCIVTGTCGSLASSVSGAFVTDALHTLVVQGGGSRDRSVCLGNSMTSILMNFGGGATGVSVTGLPTGVTSSISGTTVTISGTPTVSGMFNYSVTTTGGSCTAITLSGTISLGVGNNTISYTQGTSGSICVNADEDNETPADFIAPTGTYFNTVTFASYGTAFGSCPSFSLNSSCHASDSQSIVENDLLGNSGTIQILPSNTVFHDPCVGTFKYLRVVAYYSQAICSGTAPGTISGSDPTGNSPFSYEWQSSTSATGPYNTISGSNTKDYTPGILTQSTYFRRIVTSGGCTSTSPILLIKVNSLPTIATAAATSEVCYGGTSASLSYTGTTEAPTTYSITWNASPANTFAPVLDASITASSISIVIPSTATANTYTGTITVKNANGCISTGKNFTVTVLPQFTTGTISSTGETICSGGNPSQIGSTTDASGGDGVITYQWQANGVNIASSNSKVYTPPAGLTTTTTYTRYASDGKCNTSPTVSTGSWTVTVQQIQTAPSIGTITDVSCLGAGSVVLENLPSGTWHIVRTGLTTPQDSFSGTGTSRTITGLAADTYHFTIRTDDTCVSTQSSAVEIKDGSSTTWNGSIWSNGPPTSSKSVTISSTNGSPFATDTEACSLTINVPNGPTDPFVTVPEGVTLTITNAVTSNGKLLFESGASLIQNTTVQNSGEIVYRRKASVRRYDFTYWSMPVTKAGFKMKHLSPNTLADKYFYFDSAVGNWALDYNGEMDMLTGIGYNIRAPQDHDLTTASDFIGQFTGIPNNGNIPTAVAAEKWNMIGNPYPSAISAAQFLADNDGVGSLYFWAHANLPVNDGTDIYYRYKDDFVTYNGLGTAGPAPFDGYIAAAQGFIIKAPTATINFNNGQRRSGNNTKFFKTAESTVEKYRLWLKFANTTGDFKQILVGYAQGATNSIDTNFDATSMAASGSVDFYSINSSKKLVIQGRAWPFVKTDVVTFGYMAASKGDYIISIDQADGIFNENQEVFLQDKTTGKMTNLRLENYKFTSEAGTFNSRFVIRYVNTTLGTDDFESLENSVLVSVKDRIIKITSSQESIKEVNIFNIGAQLLYNKNNVNSSELQISNLYSSDQALLVKITLENGHSFTKKIIFSNL
ncbi:LamG-like jellyroll fold domain-containing protein [Flavobacterium sp.]|uniref:LamG-like jellyroll fold domain-containing protein n=1 Tax=Flavobacterium sp. TaxID=239 RepID=UPI002EDB4C3F